MPPAASGERLRYGARPREGDEDVAGAPGERFRGCAGKRLRKAERVRPGRDERAGFQEVDDLRGIEGVVFLNSPPPGISLTADLRQEFFDELKAAA